MKNVFNFIDGLKKGSIKRTCDLSQSPNSEDLISLFNYVCLSVLLEELYFTLQKPKINSWVKKYDSTH